MNCSDARQHFQATLDHQIEAGLQQDVGKHIAGCTACSEIFSAQQSFHVFVKKLVAGSTAPAGLKHRILDQLDLNAQPDKRTATPIPAPVRQFSSRAALATAAGFMLLFTGLLAAQSACLTPQCRMVVALKQEHSQILAGTRPALLFGAEPARINRALEAQVAGFALPDLSQRGLKPERCGVIHNGELPCGVYVKYAGGSASAESRDAVTLMALNTSETPDIECDGTFHAAELGGHCVLCWRREADGPLYVLVTRDPYVKAVAVAQLALR